MIGIEMGAQRLEGIDPTILHAVNRATLFHLVSDSDMRYLRASLGIDDAKSPEGNYIFRQWTREPGGTVSAPFTGRLELPEKYLSQLSET